MVRTTRRLALLAAVVLLFGAVPLHAASVTVAWDPNPESGVSYVVYWGTQSAVYTSSGAAGAATQYVVNGLVPGRRYYFAVQAVSSDGLVSPYSDEVSTVIPSSTSSTLTVAPSTLVFAARKAGASGALTSVTSAQAVTVNVSGPTTTWTASANQSWVQVLNGSGTGSGQFSVSIVNPNNVLGGTTNASATVTVRPASGNPVTVTVNLGVTLTTGSSAPFGQVDTPSQGAAGVMGTIGMTGWALDDVGVTGVQIYRNCLASDENAGACQTLSGVRVAFVGNAVFLSGARPDVEATYTSYPQAQRAGWGFLMLTNMLPNVNTGQAFGGQGTFSFYAFAVDADGNRTLLGRSQADHTPTSISVANASIAKPFGAIDTPSQGQTVSGSLANFGWVLTPDSNTTAGSGDILMPTNGSTVTVYVDGVAVGTVSYNNCRGTVGNPVPAGVYCDDDIANIFGNPLPQAAYTTRAANATRYRNLDAGRGAIGAFTIDTTALSNGIHTLAWGVSDSSSRTEGIGSRFFTVLNGASADAAVAADAQAGSASATSALADAPAQVRGDARGLAALPAASAAVRGRTGLDPQGGLEDLAPDAEGVFRVQLPELGRLELDLGRVEGGYLVANGTLRDLPPGSNLDPASGRFTWMPGVGYVGSYELSFLRGGERIPVVVTIRPVKPAAAGESEIRMFVDEPQTGQTVSGAFQMSGWAFDPQASIGSGMGAIHVWAQRRDAAGDPVFLGEAQLNGERPDVAQAFGAQFNRAGWGLIASLAAGQYDVTAYVWNIRTARWEDARTVRVNVR